MTIRKFSSALSLLLLSSPALATLYSCLDVSTGQKVMRSLPCDVGEKQYSAIITSVTKKTGNSNNPASNSSPWYANSSEQFDPVEKLLIDYSERFRRSGNRAGSMLASDCMDLLVRYNQSKSSGGVKPLRDAMSDQIGKLLVENVQGRIQRHNEVGNRNTGRAVVDSVASLIDYLTGSSKPRAKEQQVEVENGPSAFRGTKERDGYSELRNDNGQTYKGHVDDGVLYDEKGQPHFLYPK